MATTAQQGFVDPYNYDYSESYLSGMNSAQRAGVTGEVGLPGLFQKLFGVDVDQQKQFREMRAQQEYERASIDSARAWSEYMENTQYQRRVKDLEAAGLNPWLAVQNGISGSGAPSVDTGGSAQNQQKSGQSSSWLAQLLLAIAKMVG